jgi:hypothetical protein
MSKVNAERLLFDLIHSLTKSEKRSFKLYAKRSGDTSSAKFVRLFDIMERMSRYDEAAILKKLDGVSKAQFSNQKVHLYAQLLASLRQSYLNHDIDIQLREQLDYIRLLYKKGLYDQSLRLLNKAKNVTGQYRKDLFQLSLLDYEKQIRSQQVFDLEEDQVNELDLRTNESMKRFGLVQHFFSIAIKLKARFVEKGVVKNEEERLELKRLYGDDLNKHDEAEMMFNEQFYLYRAFYWYSYLTYDFESCTHYAVKWVNLFEETGMDTKRRAAFLKGLNRLLQSAFRANDVAYFDQYYDKLLAFDQQAGKPLASNTALLLTKYRAIQLFNSIFLHASFTLQLAEVEDTLEAVKEHQDFMDRHTLLIIYYKAAIYFFALHAYDRALELMEHVIEDKGNLRSDLKGFARIVRLIILYEQAEEDKLERKIRTTYAYLKLQENLGAFQSAILEFIKDLGNIYPQDIKEGFRGLKAQLEQLREDKYQSRPLLYFDIISYLDAKIEGKTFAAIVKRKVSENK